jgi:hypothetical protein
MEQQDMALGNMVLQTMAEAYPQPVHFSYLGLALGVSGGAMWRALRHLRAAGLIEVDRSLASRDIPFAQPRITGKGIAVVAGLAAARDDAADSLRRLEAATLSQLKQKRGEIRGQEIRSAVVAPSRVLVPTQKAERQLGTATA